MVRGRSIRWRRVLIWAGLGVVVVFLLIQLVPYGRAHANPPVTQEPRWDSPQTRSLAERACFDCHSNLTEWRWYSNIAPVSWLIQSDVDSGREHLNFSEWNRAQEVDLEEIAESIGEGSMPPWYYLPLHADAKLTQAEKDALIAGLQATLRASPPGG